MSTNKKVVSVTSRIQHSKSGMMMRLIFGQNFTSVQSICNQIGSNLVKMIMLEGEKSCFSKHSIKVNKVTVVT